MEESQEILLKSLESLGVPIPRDVSSIQDLTPATLVSICAHSLRMIGNTSSFPTTLPESMADRFKICADLATSVKDLGYIGDISFHKFLYPSEEDIYKLVRFLVGRLSESSATGKSVDKNDKNAEAILNVENFINTPRELAENIDDEVVHPLTILEDLRLRTESAVTKHKDDFVGESDESNSIPAILNVENFENTPKELTHNNDDGVHPLTRLEELTLRTEVVESSVIMHKYDFVGKSNEFDSTTQKTKEVTAVENRASTQDTSKDELTSVENGRVAMEIFQDARNSASGNGETVARGDSKHVSELEQTLTSPREISHKVSYEIEKLRNQEKLLLEEVMAKSSELQHLEEKQELLKAAVEMACGEQNLVDSCITKLNEQVDARRQNLVELESKWDAIIKPLEKKKRSLEKALSATRPEYRGKLQKLKQIELETQSILSETKKRDEELSKLSTELEKQPKLSSRRSYIERIKEITKNSWKQDIDLERILKETRELQLESNSIQERLHRTYAVVDETVLREAKKDQVGLQVYRLLTSIHESFEQISEKILATDRTRREVADHEARLSAIASRSLNIDKLQADLDAIRKENEISQSHFHNT